MSRWNFSVNIHFPLRLRRRSPDCRAVASMFGLSQRHDADNTRTGFRRNGAGMDAGEPTRRTALAIASHELYDRFGFGISPGQIVAVVGPSGSGKSALLGHAIRHVRNAIVLKPDAMTQRDEPAVECLGGDASDLPERLAVLSRCGLAEAAVLLTRAGDLSGGQQYRLALAETLWRAISRAKPALVLADEFASNLDLATARAICRQLRRLVSASRGKLAILLATPREELLRQLQPDVVIHKPLFGPPVIETASEHCSARSTAALGCGPRSTATLGCGPRSTAAPGCGPRSTAAPGCEALGHATGCTRRPSAEPVAKDAKEPADPTAVHPTTAAPTSAPLALAADPMSACDDPACWPIVPGTLADYRLLARFHYLAQRPACFKRIWTIRAPNPSPSQPAVAAVMVISPPVRCCHGRNVATQGRYVHRSRRRSLALLNAEVETISRVIVHPMYRSAGLAVRLVRHALARADTPYVEALAAMGSMHPLFTLAGMTAFGPFDGATRRYTYYIASESS